jgi:hypothetical protein
VVGFYLINIGYVVKALKLGEAPMDAKEVLEALSTKVGTVLLVLGFMHFFNLLVFTKMRKKAIDAATRPLVPRVPPPIHP